MTVKAIHKESSFSAIRTRCRAGRSTKYVKSHESTEVISGCSNCGKSKEEIQKAFEHGKEPSHEEVIRRLREAGLDPTKLK